jgi:hypothetical protein
MSTRKQFEGTGRGFDSATKAPRHQVRGFSHRLYSGLLKFTFGFLIFLASAQAVFSQAPYLGGNGDGYDMGSTLVSVAWDITEFDSLTVFPNLVAPGDVVYIAVQGIRKKLEILAHDAVGKLVWKTTQWDLGPSVLLEMPTGNLAAGVYVLDIRVDGVAQQRKIVVQRK